MYVILKECGPPRHLFTCTHLHSFTLLQTKISWIEFEGRSNYLVNYCYSLFTPGTQNRPNILYIVRKGIALELLSAVLSLPLTLINSMFRMFCSLALHFRHVQIAYSMKLQDYILCFLNVFFSVPSDLMLPLYFNSDLQRNHCTMLSTTKDNSFVALFDGM